jgi:N-acetylglucosamine-6-sulfatase
MNLCSVAASRQSAATIRAQSLRRSPETPPREGALHRGATTSSTTRPSTRRAPSLPVAAICLAIAISSAADGDRAADAPAATSATAPQSVAGVPSLKPLPDGKPRNIVFILADDHRYDALGFMGHPFLQTPHLDSLARNGVHLKNAFVTTALCSPSRASILTGLYAHRHRVVDNNNPVPPGTVFFPQYLQRAGYATAFIGKWHMGGESDAPQPGFDHWVSFRGQGTYLPSASGLNVNGQRVPQKGYITDELTDYALDWLEKRPAGQPFFLYLSHKGVHADFVPAERHKGRYKDKPFPTPKTMALTKENLAARPMWVQNQRNSWHGVDFPYHSDLDIAEYYRRYCETLLGVDNSVGRVLDWLRRRGLLDSTLVIYMGDNGFAFGEHGLIDKRTAYEESMRVPLLMQCPELFKGGTVVEQMVANLDLAPTILEAAALQPPEGLDGKSFLRLAQGKSVPWRDALLYEYYWERNFPHTPTLHALRTDRFKYIHVHGLWDLDELYDLKADPLEAKNLISSREHQATARELNRKLFDLLEQTQGMWIPLYPDRGGSQNLRRASGAPTAQFPPELIRDGR